MDTIQGASLEAGPLGGRHSRTGLVKEIDTTGSADPLVLDKALAVVLAAHPWHEAHPSGDGSALSKVFIFPVSYNMCRVQLIYDINEFPIQSAYLLRDDGYMQGWTGSVLPGTGESISTGWEERYTGTPPAGWKPATVPADYIPMTLSHPVRTLSVTAIIFGTPSSSLTDANGYVNNTDWYGKPKGYWRIDRLVSDLAAFRGYYTFSASCSTRNYKDWSETGILRNRQTGRYVPVYDDEVTELLGRTYSYGVMQGGIGTRVGKAGIVRTCPHPEASFSTIFGF